MHKKYNEGIKKRSGRQWDKVNGRMARDNEPIYEKITNKYTLNNNNNNSNSKSSPDIYPGFSQRLVVDTLHFNANPGTYIGW